MEGVCLVNSEPDHLRRYALSFTTGGLLASEGAVLSQVFLEHGDWEWVRDIAVAENLLQSRTYSTGVRRVRETVKRLTALSDRELALLPDLTSSERGHLMWAAACRRYGLIGDFAEEVLRERYLTLVGTVSYEEYDSFYRTKSMWHEELTTVSVSTYKKLRSELFRMMVQAEMLTANGVIETALLTDRLLDCLDERIPSDVRFFPTKVL